MIVNNSYAAGDAVSIRLTTGEELIGKFVTQDISTITFKSLLTIGIGHDGKLGVQGFMLGGGNTIEYTLNKSGILATVKTNAELKADYIKITTGIETRPMGIIT